MTELSEEIIARFSAYVDDELSPEERAAFLKELDEDPALAEAFAMFQSTLDTLHHLAPPAAPPDFNERVRRRIRRRSRGRAFQQNTAQRFQILLFLLVAFVLLGAIALFAYQAPFQPVAVDTEEGDTEEGDETEPSEPGRPGGGAPDETDDPPGGESSDEAQLRDDYRVDDHLSDPPTSANDARPLSQSQASPGDVPIAPANRIEFAYEIVVELEYAVLGDRLRGQFGRDNVEEHDPGVFTVRVPVARHTTAVERIVAWGGAASRTTAIIDPAQTDRVIIVTTPTSEPSTPMPR